MDEFTAYKFRAAATNAQQERLLEILHTGRLWCADWRSLNDPMEGLFESSRNRSHVDTIVDYKLGYRVCSLAGTWRALPLWAYYASDFSGVAVEVGLPRLDALGRSGLRHQDEIISKVQYRAAWSFLDPGDCPPNEAAARVLLSKHSAWRHEKEVRVLSRSEYFAPEDLRRLLIGPRMDRDFRHDLLRVCSSRNIECSEIYFSSKGLGLRRISRGGPYRGRRLALA